MNTRDIRYLSFIFLGVLLKYSIKKEEEIVFSHDLSWKNPTFISYLWDIFLSMKRYYYTVEDWKEKAEDYLGAIPLKSIYEVNMLDPNEYKRKDFPFRI